MLKRAWLLLPALLLPCLVWAQEDAAAETPAAEPAEAAESAEGLAYESYDAAGFGFSIKLPASGVTTNPDAEGWDAADGVAFEWTAGADEPITLILGRIDVMETQLDDDTFGAFCTALLEMWSAYPEQYTVVTANDQVPINERGWNLIEVADSSAGADNAVHFSVFSTYAGDTIYTVSMYYLKPLSREIQEYGIPVIHGFSLTGGE